VAAIFVAVLVIVAAVRIAVRNVGALMDRAPASVADRIEEAVRAVPGVAEVRSIRVREAGGEYFADVVVGVPRLDGLERSHHTMDVIEDSVERQVGRTHVTVHAEPIGVDERASERVAAAALRVPGVVEVHNVTVLDHEGGRAITLHARVEEDLPLREAGAIVRLLKGEIAREIGAARVYVHLEPFAPDPQAARDVSAELPDVHAAALAAVRRLAGDEATVVLYRQGRRLLVVTTLRAGPSVRTVQEAHLLASRVEDAVRDALPDVDEVIVEVSEPQPVRAPVL
jgi:divalent metal cation (Fe/Co/Zn/Cd) transporter